MLGTIFDWNFDSLRLFNIRLLAVLALGPIRLFGFETQLGSRFQQSRFS